MVKEKIINENVKGDIMDPKNRLSSDERMDMALHQILTTVALDGSVFIWFIQVLRDEDVKKTIALADKLEQEYQEKIKE